MIKKTISFSKFLIWQKQYSNLEYVESKFSFLELVLSGPFSASFLLPYQLKGIWVLVLCQALLIKGLHGFDLFFFFNNNLIVFYYPCFIGEETEA